VVDAEYKADLIVYKTDKDYRAKANENKGIWYFTDKSYRADKKVYFTDRPTQADLKVYFTDKDYRAGWKSSEKKPLLY
jgi:lipocalin